MYGIYLKLDGELICCTTIDNMLDARLIKRKLSSFNKNLEYKILPVKNPSNKKSV